MKSSLTHKTVMIKTVAAILLLALVSCGRKWKETTNVTFTFHLKNGTVPSGLLFQEGSMHLNEIHFTGLRKRGADVDFRNTPSSELDLASGSTVPVVVYDIPQGVYHSIDLEMKMDQSGSGPYSIQLEGTYINTSGDTLPVIFEFHGSQVFSMHAQSTGGGNEITLVEGTPANADVYFDAPYWFATLTSSQLESADETTIDNENVILINESDNAPLYQLIITRITESNTAVFH